jgi:hypothetical protein
MTPFSRFIKIFHLHSDIDLNFDTILFKEGQNWAQTQTWDKLTDIYEQLWQKK